MKHFLPLAFLVVSLPAWAQSGELWFSGGESILSNSGLGSNTVAGKKDDYKLDNGLRFGFRFTTNTETIFGHEFGYTYNRSHLRLNGVDQGGMAIHQGGYNFLVYGTKEGTRIRPFGTGGVHFSNFVPPGSSATSGGGNTKFGLNYGGGVKVRIDSKWSARVDFRRYETTKPFDLPLKSGWLHQTEISAGAGIHF